MVRLNKTFLTGSLLLVFYTISYTALQSELTRTKTAVSHSASGIWSLPDVALQLIAGEFKGLLSDYLILEVGAQLGTKLLRTPGGGYRTVTRTQDWSSIYRIFTASQVLDPSFQQSFTLAQGWLPWEGLTNETRHILTTADKNRPWDWQPLHFMGFNTYYFLNDTGEAGNLFLQAASRPHAPKFLAIVGARLAQKGGETNAAITLMKSMLLNKDTKDPDYREIKNRLLALKGSLTLEGKVADYKTQFGFFPRSPAELVSQGLLKQLPYNPYGVDYCIARDGKVYFDNELCRKEDPLH